jgi:peptide/nickel transport system permease protein
VRDALWHLILPAVALSTVPMAVIMRMTRSAMLEVLRADYIRTARAKGLRERTITVRHAFKNAALPVVTTIGLQVGFLLSGAILTETIFSWPGIGRWVFDSILLRDYPVVQGMTLIVATIFVTVNLFIDLVYAALDPRISYR